MDHHLADGDPAVLFGYLYMDIVIFPVLFAVFAVEVVDAAVLAEFLFFPLALFVPIIGQGGRVPVPVVEVVVLLYFVFELAPSRSLSALCMVTTER